MTISVALVGAGPSGFYTAQALMDQAVDCRVDLIDTLPTPYGLIRGGVAPDHQHTKRVTRTYERIASQPNLSFDGICLRGELDADPVLGYAIYKRFALVISESLANARLQMVDMYGVGKE